MLLDIVTRGYERDSTSFKYVYKIKIVHTIWESLYYLSGYLLCKSFYKKWEFCYDVRMSLKSESIYKM